MVGTQERIVVGETTLPFTLKRSHRARALRMAVYPGGSLVVTAPKFVSNAAIHASVHDRALWIFKAIQRLRAVSPLVLRGKKKEYAAYKSQALSLAQTRLAHFSLIYGTTYGKITIRNQKTRWGSCSKAGNLSFNYKIALLPPALADYIVVHELCHLKEHNHSVRFWALVAETIPDFAQRRAQLRSGRYPLVV